MIALTCPMCGGDTRVQYSRDYGDYIDRWRKCYDCGYGFHTIETDEDMYQRLKVKEKDDGKRD